MALFLFLSFSHFAFLVAISICVSKRLSSAFILAALSAEVPAILLSILLPDAAEGEIMSSPGYRLRKIEDEVAKLNSLGRMDNGK